MNVVDTRRIADGGSRKAQGAGSHDFVHSSSCILRSFDRQRGSTFIIVLAILSILILIAATLSYTARLEEISARNFAEGIQSRMAAQTAVGWFFAAVDGRTTRPAPLWSPPVMTPTSGGLAVQPLAAGLPAGATGWQPGTPPPWGLTSPTLGRVGLARAHAPTLSEPGFSRRGNLCTIATNLAQMRVEDESAKININALGSWAELEAENVAEALQPEQASASTGQSASASIEAQPPVGLADALYAILSSPEVGYPEASREMARQLARSILRYRYGPDGLPGRAGFDDDGDGPGGTRMQPDARTPLEREPEAGLAAAERVSGLISDIGHDGLDNDLDRAVDEPGEGIDEPDEFVADPRLPAHGDDRPFRQVEDLLLVEGVTPMLFHVLRPYVTVFSTSERRVGPERDAPAQMDLNAARPVEVYERLRAAFPEVSPEAIAQFAVNMTDYHDADSVPTLVQLEGTAEPILGVEVTPHITEVWPDSITDERDGDDGQFIEIYNPYDVAISLAGWSLRIDDQGRANLHGTLEAGGFLIVTDDYNEEHDPTPEDDFPGYGSFYDIFGAVPNARNRQMIEIPELEIPNTRGAIELCDAAGNLVDVFRYSEDVESGLRRSYQRDDPRVRVSRVARCSPYGLADGASDRASAASGQLIASATIKNAPFQSALELFEIGSSFLGGQSRSADPPNGGWQTPAIGATQPDSLDERLVDLFTVWIDRQPVLAADQAIAGDTISTQTVTGEARAVAGLSSLSECGRININSAPVAVLRVLPGLSNRQIEHLLVRRDVALRTDPAGGPIVYGQWSELLADDGFWADASPSARLRQVGEWIASVTFTSNAYRIVSENRTQPPSGPRLASRSRVEALVATDGMQNQVVAWRYLK